MSRWMLFFCCLLFSAGAAAQEVTLQLEFFYGGTKVADVTDVLRVSESADGGAVYEIDSDARAVGLAKLLHGDTVRRSRGRVDAEYGLLMTMYYDKRGTRKEQQARLTEGRLFLQRGDEKREEAVQEPVFDYLTLLYRSYFLGAPIGGEVLFTNGWRLRNYDYREQGMETVATGMGEMEAVLLVRSSDRGDRKIWLAPSLGYLPVRAYVNDKGHEFTTVMQSVSR